MHSKFKTIVNGIMPELLFTREIAYKNFYLVDGKYLIVFHVGGIYVGRESMSGSLMIQNEYVYDTIAYVTHRPVHKVSRLGVLKVMIGIVRELINNPIVWRELC